MFTLLHEKEYEDYYNPTYAAIEGFIKIGEKRLLGRSSDLLCVHPAGGTQLMKDLIDVMNTETIPNPDVLMGKYLLERFDKKILENKKYEHETKLLSFAKRFCKKSN